MHKRRDPLEEAQRLADFTDQLLAGEKPERLAAPSGSRDLADLQATVDAIHRSSPPAEPEAALRERIHTRLAEEWRRSGPGKLQAGKTWRPSRQVRRAMVAWSAVIVSALVLIGIFVVPQFPAGLSGAAQSPGAMLLLVLAGLGLIGFILWRYRNKP